MKLLSQIIIILALFLFWVSSVRSEVRYSVIDLGVLSGDYGSRATDINNRGQIVGNSETIDNHSHAFLWQNGRLTRLAIPQGYERDFTLASSINDRGQAVGYAYSIGQPSKCRAFLWQNSEYIDLGTLGSGFSSASGINNRGQVVGGSSDSTWRSCAFYWHKDIMTSFNTFPDAYFIAPNAINDRGMVVGRSAIDAVGVPYHAFLWQDNSAIDLGTLGSNSEASSINNRGQIVGYSHLCDGVWHAFLWENGLMTDLGTLGGIRSYAADINNVGQIVGNAENLPDNTQAVLWQDGKIYRLNDLIPKESGWDLRIAAAINDLGQIVGFGYHDGWKRAYLIDPVPRPQGFGWSRK